MFKCTLNLLFFYFVSSRVSSLVVEIEYGHLLSFAEIENPKKWVNFFRKYNLLPFEELKDCTTRKGDYRNWHYKKPNLLHKLRYKSCRGEKYDYISWYCTCDTKFKICDSEIFNNLVLKPLLTSNLRKNLHTYYNIVCVMQHLKHVISARFKKKNWY